MNNVSARTFRDLMVWQKAHQFVLLVYKYTNSFPKEEIYGLTSQFRRCAVSVPANIAEGFKKASRRDKAHLMNISQGSLEECRYYLILSSDLEYGSNGQLLSQLEEVSKLLNGYRRALLANDYQALH
ncbi:MAG TPA: four helix bundle protein [Pyrinomonadaceae bacterium]|nr:four helix bundle protein [Pyrinomonadaceae bacterium]